ncbi:diacylglycerol/lipid kinase family protein [Kroppenstedtia eburnea]|uniref:Lipid kinase, YegS/Rv2252/BmrU family n=1 Tax=Kroppenstedtia eburnea TaxID=714067 RepID=A0A1N7NDY1_9BACL|nr:diacylglycerol kinase family protein [Kroppenstedtia eburnea]QKI83053.1 diacylglycerol kinase family lipid kinase [Kroppenstedtia eburnea]SIS96502.1 lipid kinase, YegS/Rv2252/BmrU family [Kroppenstedtia eburnea]
MERVDLIVNPAAGQGRLLEHLPRITRRLKERFPTVNIRQTEKPGDGARWVENEGGEADLVIAAGGDGTVHELANALSLLPDRPRFAILPGGTCNDFSRAVGMEQDIPAALDQILQGWERKVDVGMVDGERFFLNFWGIGLITQVSARIDGKNKERYGRLAYYLSAAQNLLNPCSFQLSVTWDDGSFEGEAAMLLVGNGSYIGGVPGFFPHSRLDDGRLDVLLVKEASLDSLWSMLASHVTREWPESDDLLYFHTRSLSIQAEPAQNIDCDGEKGSLTPSEIRNLSAHLTLLAGEKVSDEQGY